MITEQPCSRPSLTATQPSQPTPRIGGERSRLGVGAGLRLGVRVAVRLEPDPRTDRSVGLSGQVNAADRIRRAAATDPLMGVSRWGEGALGGRL